MFVARYFLSLVISICPSRNAFQWERGALFDFYDFTAANDVIARRATPRQKPLAQVGAPCTKVFALEFQSAPKVSFIPPGGAQLVRDVITRTGENFITPGTGAEGVRAPYSRAWWSHLAERLKASPNVCRPLFPFFRYFDLPLP